MMDYSQIPHGDMPGDKICINDTHVAKANLIYPRLLEEIQALRADTPAADGAPDAVGALAANVALATDGAPDMQGAPARKLVIGVCGGSGVGKSETASLLGWMLTEDGMPAYILSGDNYPHRIPAENDAERRRVYEAGGEAALRSYLGSQAEADYEQLNAIIASFKAGDPIVRLKRMGRTADEIWYDDVDMSNIQFLIIEWTHANSDLLRGVDITVLLNSTPEETLAHRRKRARDGAVDSPFTMLILKVEQEQLMAEAHKAKIIVTKDGSLIPYEEYCQVMGI